VYPKQEEAIFRPIDKFGSPARVSVIEASTKTGKTTGCMLWQFEEAWASQPGQNHWWVAPVFPQAEIAFRRLKQGLPKEIFIANEGKLTLTLKNGAVIWFKSAEKPDNLYGEDVYSAVVDEASRMRQEAYFALRTTLTATRGPLRIIGNVKGRRNWFYEIARKAQMGEPGFAYYKMIAADAVAAGVLNAEEIAQAERDLPEQVFRELYLAEPSDDGGNPFGLDHIAACVQRGLAPGDPVAWGWDLGKSIDWTVGTGLNKQGNVCRFLRFQKPWPQTIETIRHETGKVPALVDSTGLGDPVVEELQRSLGGNFEGFKFTPASKQRLMEGLAVAIQQRSVGVLEGPMKEELDMFEYEYTRTGVRYSAPEGFHDDCVCSLALAVSHKGHARQPLIISPSILDRARMPSVMAR